MVWALAQTRSPDHTNEGEPCDHQPPRWNTWATGSIHNLTLGTLTQQDAGHR